MKKIITLIVLLTGMVSTVSAQIAESGKITVYFQNTQNWEGPFYIYFEKDSEHYGYDWPGKPAQTTTIDGVTWYYRTEEISGDKTGFVAKFNNSGTNEAIWNNVWYDVYATIDGSSVTHRYNTYFLYNTDTHLSIRLDNEGTSIYSTTIDNQTSSSNQKFVVANIDAYNYTTTIQSDKWNTTSVIRPINAADNTPVYFETMNFTQGWSRNSTGSWVISASKPAYYTFKFKTDNTYMWDAYITRTLNAAAGGYATFSHDTYDVIPDPTLMSVRYASAIDGSGNITWTDYASTGIKAGEGALLKGTAGSTYKFTPASSAVAPTTNLLKAISTEQSIPQTSEIESTIYYNYILTNKKDDGYSGYTTGPLGFYKVNIAGSWCAAGTAYIQTTFNAAAARGYFPVEDNTESVESIAAEQKSLDAPVYDLQGRCVTAPQKGLYIVNGKKIVINK